MKPFAALINNPYFNAVKNIKRLLDPDQKRSAVIMVILLFLNAIADFAGLATIGALMVSALKQDIFGVSEYTPDMATSPAEFQIHNALRWLYEWTNVGKPISFLFFLSMVIFVVFIVKNVVSLYIFYIQARFGYNISLRLNKKMFKYFYEKGYLFIKDSTSGKKVYNIVDVPMKFASSYFISVLGFSTELVVISIMVIAIFFIDPLAVILMIVTIVPTFALIYGFSKSQVKRIGSEMNELSPRNYAKVFESL
ncbi:MAG: hypothetical protein AAFQ02_11915, partial [Bacteroidota bacterium]